MSTRTPRPRSSSPTRWLVIGAALVVLALAGPAGSAFAADPLAAQANVQPTPTPKSQRPTTVKNDPPLVTKNDPPAGTKNDPPVVNQPPRDPCAGVAVPPQCRPT